MFIAFNTWNFLFYKNVLGLSGTLCGLAVMISLTIDGVADPIVGFISDRWRSKLGRRHPFLFASAIPLGISFYCIYVPPAALSGFSLFLWFTFFSILFRQSLDAVPGAAPRARRGADRRLPRALGRDGVEQPVRHGRRRGHVRVRLGLDQEARRRCGARRLSGPRGRRSACSRRSRSSHRRSSRAIKSRAWRKTKPEDAHFSLRELVRDTLGCFENRNYRTMVLGLLFISASLGTIETLNSFMSLFFWGLPEEKIASFGLVSPLSFVIAFFLATLAPHQVRQARDDRRRGVRIGPS